MSLRTTPLASLMQINGGKAWQTTQGARRLAAVFDLHHEAPRAAA
ncbi:hypothetical protein [Paraburkholderia phenoliruptrix]|nr:hypothetical protein [Paraburkholderia phenoliruptrix]